MRVWSALLLCAALLVGCETSTPSQVAAQQRAAEESGRLREWFDARYEEQLDFSPLTKTRLGRKDDYDRIDDFSESSAAAQLEWRRQSVRDLTRDFDRALLAPEDRASYDLWLYALERAEAAWPFRRREYLFHQMDGPHTELPQALINFHRVDDEADMVAYVARVGEVDRAIRQSLERAQLAAGEGVHAPRFAYEAVLTQARALLAGAPFAGAGDSPLKADAGAKIAALVENGKIDAARADELRAAVDAALLTQFKPAYDALIAWVEADLVNTDEIATGIWKLPDGPAYYADRLLAMTTTRMTADEIHELGLAEVARIQNEMEVVRRQVGFEGTLQEFFASLRNNERFLFPNTDDGREGYLQASRDFYAGVEARLPEFFGLRPKGGLVVKRVEAFREQPGAAQHYVQGTPDGSRPGTYYVHLLDMNAMPKVEMESVAYHEGIPGHHMQVAIAQELTGVPTFRTQSFHTAYGEGWGLYAERLAKEMGGYQDPYSDFGRLGAEIWRAVRLVVDTGLHAKGWTEQQAVDYFLANAPTSEGQVRAEVRRYIVMPGQATAYKVGMLKILELRERARAALGDRFDIRAFHDTVLGGGSMPLSLLERRVDDWIAVATAAPAAAPGSKIGQVEEGLTGRVHVVGEPADSWSLTDRMRLHNVPGVSVAVLVDGEIAWAKGYGVLEAGKPPRVNPDTIFQVASISKPVTAIAALRMVEQSRLALDAQINDYLRSWKVPDNAFTTQHPVTLRQLLSHTAGLTVHGFPGYAAGVPVPTVPQVLDGSPPANTPAVRVDKVPGESWRYSGGGYTVLQLAMTDVAGQPFPELVRELVLEPAGMTRSAFSQPLPEAERANAATAHRGPRVPIPGHSHTYPEMAAAGLWSTPSDLLRLARAVVAANKGERGAILGPSLTQQMLTVQSGDYGLGFAVAELGDGKVFLHSGGNEGFISMLFAYADGHGGAAIMTNGPNGGALASEIVASIAAAHGWQYGAQEQRTALALTPERAAQFAGVYVAKPGADQPDLTITISAEGSELWLEAPPVIAKERFYVASEDQVFVRDSPLLPFDVDADGRPLSILLAPGVAAARQAQ